MASLVLSTVARNNLANNIGLNTMLDGGTMETRSGSSPGPNSAATGTLLVTHSLPDAANNSPSGGVLTLGSIPNANGAANGTAGYCRFIMSNSTVVCDGDAGTASTTVIFDNTSITDGQVVSISSANFTVPAGT
jgi:hypothetical protein